MIHIILQPRGYMIQIYRADRIRVITKSDGTKYRLLHYLIFTNVTQESLSRVEHLIECYGNRVTRRRNQVFTNLETIVIID